MHKALLGNPTIDELHLISRVESVKDSIDYRGEYPELFCGLGKMEAPYKIALKDDTQPFAINVPRRVALPLMDKTKKELRRMEDAGVIVRVEQPTDWCAPMVVVPKKDDVTYPTQFPSVILLSFHPICQEYSPPVSNT